MDERALSRRVPTDRAATSAEVRSAVVALTQPELLRLERFARWRVRGLGRRALGRSHEDLLGDAIHATLDGRRNWNKASVSFVGHLFGAIQSISDNWGKRYKETEPLLESEVAAGPSGAGPMGDAVAMGPTQEDEIAARQSEEEIARLFEDDPLVTLIVCELKEGGRLREIRERYEISDHEYEAAMKRLRRRIARTFAEGRDA